MVSGNVSLVGHYVYILGSFSSDRWDIRPKRLDHEVRILEEGEMIEITKANKEMGS